MVAAITRISWYGASASEPAGVSAMDNPGIIFNREDSKTGTGALVGLPIPLTPATVYSWPKLVALDVVTPGTTNLSNRRLSLTSVLPAGLHWFMRGLPAYVQPAALVDNTVANNMAPTQAPPPIPTLVAAGSGGGWTALTAWVFLTYVGVGGGETIVGVVASQAVVASGTLTITSPPTVPGAAGWYAYAGVGGTQPADAAMYRQQAPGVPTALGTDLVLLAAPTTTGLNPPVANTAAAFMEATAINLPLFDNTVLPSTSTGRNGGFCEMVLGADMNYSSAGGASGVIVLPPYRLLYDET